MKCITRNLLTIAIILIALFFSGCEKDLYEEKIIVSKQGKINNVTISQVPQLIPIIQQYNRDYNYLSDSNATHREGDGLDLDLEHIIEYVQVNGLKSYSIVIQKEFEEYENMYFENLHIYEKDGQYKGVIFKYDEVDDAKKFDPTTFTGNLDIYDIDNVHQGVVQVVAGRLECVKIVIGCWVIVIMSDGNFGVNDDGCPGSSGSDNPPSGGDSGAGDGDGGNSSPTGGTNYGGTGSTGTGNTSGTPTGDDPTGVIHTVLVPNVPVWPEFAAQHIMANLICQRLELGTEELYWLRAIPNLAITTEIYRYLYENDSEEDILLVISIIERMRQNPSLFVSIKPFLIEEKIYDDPLDPCNKAVLNTLKNTCQNDISFIFAKLDDSPSVYNVVINNQEFSNPITPGRALRYNPTGNNNALRYSYIINMHPYYENSTKLFKASILIHELIHCYFFSLIDDLQTGNDLGALDNFPTLFQAFVNKKYPNSIADAHHEDMALLYVSSVARTLQEYQTGIPVPTNSEPEQIYTDLAWGGLRAAPIFDTLFPVGSNDRQRIIDRYSCEGLNYQVGSQEPIGSNCN